MVDLNLLIVMFGLATNPAAFIVLLRLGLEEFQQDRRQFDCGDYRAENTENQEYCAKIGVEAANVVYHDELLLFEAANAAINLRRKGCIAF